MSLPYATFGLAVNSSGRVFLAPPIASWALGRDYDEVLLYYRRKHAKIELING